MKLKEKPISSERIRSYMIKISIWNKEELQKGDTLE